MANTIVSGTMSNMLAPGLNEVFNTALNESPSQWSNFYNSNSSNRAWEEDLSWTGFEPFQEYGELEDIDLRGVNEGPKTKYVHRKWGLGYQISQEAIDDNLYGVVSEYPALLARAFRATKEILGASIFNLGFSSYVGADSKALFATDHVQYGPAGGSQANTFSTPRALSHTALKDAIINMKRTRADDNIFAPASPAILLVPDQLEFAADEILNTVNMPYSGDNTKNVLNNRLQVQSWSYLTDSDNWFLLAPKAQTKLKYWDRWPMRTIMKDRELNQSMVHLSYARFSFGFSHWYGTYGVQGN